MKVKTRGIEEGMKCPRCNWEYYQFFQLDGWDKDDWMCGSCLAEELSQNEYEVNVK